MQSKGQQLHEARVLVTGGAGFIGSHIVDSLMARGAYVRVLDNFSSGRKELISQHSENKRFCLVEGDLLNGPTLEKALEDVDIVFHIAADPDVRLGATNSAVHFEQNILATYKLLEAMRQAQVSNIVFTSTSTVYGEALEVPTPEDYGPLVPISLYGASKLACEALITSYSHTFNMRSWLFRFANIIGKRSNHGIIVDFIEKLRKAPDTLEILGDGKQSKSYLHVEECVDGLLFAVENGTEQINIFNVGSEDTITATDIGMIVIREMGLEDVEITYTGGKRGWKGDVPRMMLSVDKLKELGWAPGMSSEECVRATVASILKKD